MEKFEKLLKFVKSLDCAFVFSKVISSIFSNEQIILFFAFGSIKSVDNVSYCLK